MGPAIHRRLLVASACSGLTLVRALASAGCDARSYDEACPLGQTTSSVLGSPCTDVELGHIACALPSAGVCTPLSSSVVTCRRGDEGGSGSPSWQSASSCAHGQICYFPAPRDGAPVGSNVVGCGVNDAPMTQAALPCTTEGALACSFDETTVLACRGGVWLTSTACRQGSRCGGTACASGTFPCVGCQ